MSNAIEENERIKDILITPNVADFASVLQYAPKQKILPRTGRICFFPGWEKKLKTRN